MNTERINKLIIQTHGLGTISPFMPVPHCNVICLQLSLPLTHKPEWKVRGVSAACLGTKTGLQMWKYGELARSLGGPAGARPTWTRVRDTSERTQAAIGASSQGPAGLSPSSVTLDHPKNKSINHLWTHLIIFTVHFHTSSVVSIISSVLKTALLKIHVLHGATCVLSVCSCWCFSGAFYVFSACSGLDSIHCLLF